MEEGPVGCLSEDILIQILRRLPVKSVIRAGAVCKAWREITTKESFVADHVRRRPAEVVLYTYIGVAADEPCDRRRWDITKMALDLIPISSQDDLDHDVVHRRRLMRYPKRGTFVLLASCNGVLLFQKSRGCFLVCNPTTRRWAELPRLPSYCYQEYAFYFHEPSGEYRLLCGYLLWFVLSTGAAKRRKVAMNTRQRQQASVTMDGIKNLLAATPVALDGRMHWGPRQAAGEASEVAVFDTLAEKFSVMAGPPTATADRTKLFSMEEGKLLAAADFGKAETYIDIWFLDGHNDASTGGGVGWERRHRVPTPWPPGAESWTLYGARYLDMVSLAAAADDGKEGNIMLGNRRGLVVYRSRKKKTVRAVDINSVAGSESNTIVVSRHVFRESLAMVRHPSFGARSTADLGLPPIFWS